MASDLIILESFAYLFSEQRREATFCAGEVFVSFGVELAQAGGFHLLDQPAEGSLANHLVSGNHQDTQSEEEDSDRKIPKLPSPVGHPKRGQA